MLVVFLLIIVAGLLAFIFVFKKELGREPPPAKEEPHLQDFSPSKSPVPEKSVPPPTAKPVATGSAGRDELPGRQEALAQKFDQKYVKLEQILEEKNRILARLEEDLKHEQDHRQEIDGVKEVLQQQIEESKLQNKQLKEEMSRILEENLALKSKVGSLEKVLGGQKIAPFVEQGSSAMESAQGASMNLPGGPGVKVGVPPAEGGLTLRDVFGDETEQK
jgi:hypothetical protein